MADKLPRNNGYSNGYWKDCLCIVIFAGIAVLSLFGGCDCQAGEKEEAEAAAALALAQAKREREAESVVPKSSPYQDYALAAKEAERTGKPLTLWVGCKCEDHRKVANGLKESVHCELAVWRKDKTPRVVIQGGDGNEYWIRVERLNDKTPQLIRSKWLLEFVPPIRGDVKISEEVWYVPSAFGWREDWCVGGT